MKTRWKKLAALAATCVMASTTALGFAACGNKLVVNIDPVDYATYTNYTYLSTSPSNWNELSYQDANDTEIMSYIGSNFFTYDFLFDEAKGGKFKADGSINAEAIVPGKYSVHYSAATKLEDVTAEVADDWGYDEAKVEKGGYAYKITLRDDLTWDDGTKISAADFVWTMKEQLSPDYLHYRAQEYYSANMTIMGAKEYVLQGQAGWFAAVEPYDSFDESIFDKIYFNLSSSEDNEKDYDGVVSGIVDMCLEEGYVPEDASASTMAKFLILNGVKATEEQILALQNKTMAQIVADAALKETWDAIDSWWTEDPGEELYFFLTQHTFPKAEFDSVGIYSEGNSIVLCLAKPLTEVLNADGSLGYGAAYYLSSLPLVKKDLYEKNRVAPVEGSSLWTSTYNSSVESTASWGPYKLTKFTTDVEFELVKNDKWFGYSLDDNKNQYQTDRIVYRIIKEWNTAWQYFQKGGLDAIGIDVTIADDYKNAPRAYFTPNDLTVLWNFQSQAEALTKEKGNAMLKYVDFRKALTLGVDRADYAANVTTSSSAAFGLFNSMYYYDVANGGVYRETTEAKEAILRTYGYTQGTDGKWTSATLTTPMDTETAYKTVTGYNLVEARKLLDAAYDAAVAAGDFAEGDKVTLRLGFSQDNTSSRRYYDYLNKAWTELFKGTKFEGKLNLVFDGSFGSTWATAFIDDGKYDVCCVGGWSGGDWDMPYMLSAYLGDNRYAAGWDPAGVSFSFQMSDMDAPETHTVKEWYKMLTETYVDFEMADKLPLIAKLEEVVMQTYYSCPAISARSAALRGYKCDVITTEYNTFMAYGGIRYMSYNYTDAEWKEFVNSQKKHTLNYK